MNNDEMYSRIKDILIERFEVDASAVSLQANIYDELETDRIDAVDLLVQLKAMTGKKISPEVFKEVRTIGNVLDALAKP